MSDLSDDRSFDQRGDETALFERYAKKLVRAVRAELRVSEHIAEEAAAIAWIQLLRSQPEREAIFAWLRVVAIREAIRLLRAQGREPSLDEDHADAGRACEDRRADLELTVEAREALERLGALTARQIQIFSLHVAGLTYEEISAATGHSRRAVERHVTRARRRLRDARGA
jgi:RNA polymerase sigma factor (sigma-70 family)